HYPRRVGPPRAVPPARPVPPRGAGAGRFPGPPAPAPGRAAPGGVRGRAAQPLAGAITNGLAGQRHWHREPLKTAEFTVNALQPGQPRRLLFLHEPKRLAGSVVVRGDEQGPLTVKLEPWGTLTGKLVPAEGKLPKD